MSISRSLVVTVTTAARTRKTEQICSWEKEYMMLIEISTFLLDIRGEAALESSTSLSTTFRLNRYRQVASIRLV